MQTLEEAIKHAEYIASKYSDAVSVCWSVRECEQLAAWLRELQERRKEQYLTIEQIAAVVGPQTIYSARLWFEFAHTLDVLGYGVVERRTDG